MKKIEIKDEINPYEDCWHCDHCDRHRGGCISEKIQGKTIYIADKGEKLYTKEDINELLQLYDMPKDHEKTEYGNGAAAVLEMLRSDFKIKERNG
jgi:hypothetical protein